MDHSSAVARRGFTLIELLLVIGIIAILASIVIVAINPTKQLGDARDAQRRSDVNTILNAVYQYAIDNNGRLPGYLSGATADREYQICVCNTTSCPDRVTCGLPTTAMVNLRTLSGTYLVSVPADPKVGAAATASGTQYHVERDSKNRITVCAPGKESSTIPNICVTR
jgi:type IV pilus assembly protein PilA